MKTRLNKTGNKVGETIYIKTLVGFDIEGEIWIEGTYLSIEDEYINYLTISGDCRNAHYKKCYRENENFFL